MSVLSFTGAASIAALLVLLVPSAAQAEPGEPAEPPPPESPPLFEEQKTDLAEQKKSLEDARQRIADLEQKVDSAASVSDENDWTNRFKLYGFTDVGVNRIWVDDTSPVGVYLNSPNATSFVVGNLDLYLDARPLKNWRSLVEVRFTSAPHGEVASLGGIGGKFKRTSTQQIDPNAASANAAMWGGYTVIERAHIDWTGLEYLKVRAGSFFTPFGIWNVDHGTPTLIALQLPGVIQLRQMPLRQTGVQLYGSAFKGDWELGYIATVSNGRQELSNFAFDDNRGFGGRVYANNEKGEATVKLGASFYTGRVKDQEIDVASISPLAIERKSNFDYREIVGGLDASVDIGRTRIRAETALSSIEYEPGKHELAQSASALPQYKPNSLETSAYLLVAHTLPFAPIELYATGDLLYGPQIPIADTVISPSVGMNIRFTKATMLKTQVNETFFFNTRHTDQSEHDTARNNATMLFSRLVLVF